MSPYNVPGPETAAVGDQITQEELERMERERGPVGQRVGDASISYGGQRAMPSVPLPPVDASIGRRFKLFGGDARAYLQVFNVYNRRTEWFVQYDPELGSVEPEVVTMLPVLPTVGIDFKF